MSDDYGKTYCIPNRIEPFEPNKILKKRGHGFTKSLCRKARMKRRS